MSYVFVDFRRNWADEFDVYGFRIFTAKEWEEYQRTLKGCDYATVCFGTNEEWDDESGDSFLKRMTSMEIDEDQVQFLIKLFRLNPKYTLKWGVFPSEDSFCYDDEDEDLVDDD